MNKILVLIIFILFEVSLSYTQNFSSIGLDLGLKAGVNISPAPVRRQNKIALSSLPDVALSYNMPLSEEIDLYLKTRLAFNNYSFTTSDYDNAANFKHNISYISFNPNLDFRGMILGLDFGLPITSNLEGNTVSTDIIKMYYSLQIGYYYDFFEDESAKLSVFILGHYMLNNVFDNYLTNDPLHNSIPPYLDYPINDSHNPRIAGISLGLSYQFILNNLSEPDLE